VNSNRRNCKRCIVIITDGDVNEGRATSNKITGSENVDIVCIGIGKIDEAVLQAVSTTPYAYSFSSFYELQIASSGLTFKRVASPTLAIKSISSKQIDFQFIYDDPRSVASYSLEMIQDRHWVLDGTTADTTFEAVNLKPSTSYSFRAKCTLHTGEISEDSTTVEVTTLKHRKEFDEISDPSKREQYIKNKRAFLNFIKPSDDANSLQVLNYNILLFGPMGAGKSTLINTFFTSLDGTKFANRSQISANTQETGTKQLIKITLGSSCIKLWDIYGWNDKNYADEFVPLLQGLLDHGWKERSPIILSGKGKNVGESTESTKVQAAIMLCPVDTITNSTELKKFKMFYEKFAEYNIQPIILITKIDTVNIKFLSKPEYIYDSSVVDSIIKKFSDNTVIPSSMVFPCMSYRGIDDFGFDGNPIIDFIALHILSTVVGHCETKITNILSDEKERHHISEATSELSNLEISNTNSNPSSPRKEGKTEIGERRVIIRYNDTEDFVLLSTYNALLEDIQTVFSMLPKIVKCGKIVISSDRHVMLLRDGDILDVE